MITDPTVLILGAGVSSEYGFPLGRKLLFSIVNGIEDKGRGSLFHYLRNENFSHEVLEEFARSLKESPWDSVDLFLLNRPKFERIGRYAIALSLIPCEVWEHISSRRVPDDTHLYEHIFQYVGTSRGDFLKNQLSIITFNYDRSFEEYFYRNIKSGFGEDIKGAVELLRGIEINHVYGKIGPTMYEDNEQGRYYHPDIKQDKVKQAVDGIKLFNDKFSSGDLSPSTRLIQQAKRICFLGFKYHPMNLSNLGVHHWSSSDYFDHGQAPEIYGAAYGLEPAEVEKVSAAFTGKISLGSRAEKSLQYLMNNSILK